MVLAHSFITFVNFSKQNNNLKQCYICLCFQKLTKILSSNIVFRFVCLALFFINKKRSQIGTKFQNYTILGLPDVVKSSRERATSEEREGLLAKNKKIEMLKKCEMRRFSKP